MVFIRNRKTIFIEILNISRVFSGKSVWQILDAVGRRPIVTSGNVRYRYRTALVPNIFELAGKVQQIIEFPSIPRITHPETYLSWDTGSAKNTLQEYFSLRQETRQHLLYELYLSRDTGSAKNTLQEYFSPRQETRQHLLYELLST